MPALERREFLRLAGLAALAACGGKAMPRATRSAVTIPTTGATTAASRGFKWVKRISGPTARRDHTLTGLPGGGKVFLFGGRRNGDPLGDLWIFNEGFEAPGDRWDRIAATGPSPRFGHNAVAFNQRLIVFGGQGAPGKFFNDVWAFEPRDGDWRKGSWREIKPRGAAPDARYGAGGTLVSSRLLITHGFTDAGRFDDTWSFGTSWQDVSPSSRTRPIKRCLHRAVYFPSRRQVLLFGGQTNGRPFLGDTWLYDPAKQSWQELDIPGPSPRNLYAAAAAAEDDEVTYLFGGFGKDGPMNDLWTFDGARWRRIEPEGPIPPARGGTEGATFYVAVGMLVFGGSDGDRELDDFWELSRPSQT